MPCWALTKAREQNLDVSISPVPDFSLLLSLSDCEHVVIDKDVRTHLPALASKPV